MTTYSTSLRLWEGVPGDPSITNQWGTALNENQNLVESAIIGTASVSINGLSTYTLTTANGAPDQARPLVQSYTGTLTGPCTVTLPNVPKIGWAQNATSGGQSVILSTGSGSTATIPPDGEWYLFSADGAGDVTVVSIGNGGGGGGGGNLTVTDGTHTVTTVEDIVFSGATVSGTSGTATVTVTGGGGGGSLTVTNGVTSVPNCTLVDFVGASIVGSGGTATVTITGSIGPEGPPGPQGNPGAQGPPGTGSALTITDGTHTVANATTLTVSGAIVGGTSPSATLSIAGAILNQASTGHFYANQGANINRVNDRMFMGAATVNDGNFPNTTLDYMTAAFGTAEPTTGDGTLSVLSAFGLIGVLGGSQTLNNAQPGSEGCIGVTGLALNNNATSAQTCYAGYFEARHGTGLNTNSVSQGIEVEITNFGATLALQPYQPYSGKATYGTFTSSGGGVTSGVNAATLGLLVGNNGAAFETGIMVHSTGIVGTNGITGAGVAMALAKGHVIQWYNQPGSQTSSVTSTVATASNGIQLSFTDNGADFLLASGGNALVQIPNVGGATEYLVLGAGVGSQNPVIQARNSSGSGSVNLVLTGQNSGNVYSSSNFLPSTDGNELCGGPSNRWGAVYVVGGVVQSSDARLKTNLSDIPTSLPLILDLKPQMGQWIDGGSKPVSRKVKKHLPAHQEVTQEIDDHEVQPDGSIHLVKRTVIKKEPIVDLVPVTTPDGKPVMDKIRLPKKRGAKAEYEMQPRVHAVQRTEEVEVDEVEYINQPGKRTHWWLMAQNVKATFDKHMPGVDFGGYLKDEETGVESLRYTQFIPLLVKGLQELAQKIEALEAKSQH